MGAIRGGPSGCTHILESHYVVGRSPPPQCSLTLDADYVSALHAEVRWTGQFWELKDLGSRNGTYVDGHRIRPGDAARVANGTKLGFGKREHEWNIIDDSAPIAMAVPLDGGAAVTFDDQEMLALPSKDDPQATIYRTVDGAWSLERVDEMPISVKDRQTFEAVGRTWRFCCPEVRPGTFALPSEPTVPGMYVRNMELLFSVSQNEEYVHLRIRAGDQDHDMGARQHHFLLLTLARHRLAEAAQGEPEISCGWLDQEDVAHDPSMAQARLNLSVHRIREQFARVGVLDFGSIVQRRLRQIRIGTGRVTIRTV